MGVLFEVQLLAVSGYRLLLFGYWLLVIGQQVALVKTYLLKEEETKVLELLASHARYMMFSEMIITLKPTKLIRDYY